jgi:peptidoglycan/LPS O-acetylase OafA/YrhL
MADSVSPQPYGALKPLAGARDRWARQPLFQLPKRPMNLGWLIQRENNNADLLRLVAALAVIWGHAYALAPEPGRREIIGRILGFDYSGSLAVKFFFFLSGVLVTDSLLTRASPTMFVCARFFRVIPALVVSAIICTLLMGPIFTSTPLREYFHTAPIAGIIFEHPFFDYQLPGVFKTHAYPQINGSIWTIQYELICYIMLLGIGIAGLLRSKFIGSSICVLTMALCYLDPSFVSYFDLDYGSEGKLLPGFFLRLGRCWRSTRIVLKSA